jgi:hypothetical protein
LSSYTIEGLLLLTLHDVSGYSRCLLDPTINVPVSLLVKSIGPATDARTDPSTTAEQFTVESEVQIEMSEFPIWAIIAIAVAAGSVLCLLIYFAGEILLQTSLEKFC